MMVEVFFWMFTIGWAQGLPNQYGVEMHPSSQRFPTKEACERVRAGVWERFVTSECQREVVGWVEIGSSSTWALGEIPMKICECAVESYGEDVRPRMFPWVQCGSRIGHLIGRQTGFIHRQCGLRLLGYSPPPLTVRGLCKRRATFLAQMGKTPEMWKGYRGRGV